MSRILLTGTVLSILLAGHATAAPQGSAPPVCFQAAPNAAALNRKLDNCSEIIERAGDQPALRAAAFASRGWIELVRASHDKAIADFTSALGINPDFDWALAGRAFAYLNSQKSELAIPDFDRVLAQHPEDMQLLIGRGDAFNNLKRYERGIADFDRALQIAPNNDEALNDRAWALVRLGRHAEAIKGYDAALSYATERRGLVLANRCEAKAVAGDIDAAIEDCEAALKIDATEYRYARAFANLLGRRYATAIADYDTILATAPNDAFALYGRGVARQQSGQEEAGKNDIAAALRARATIREDMAELGVIAR